MNDATPSHTLRVVHAINDLLLGGAQTAVLEITSRLNRDRFSPAVCYLNEYSGSRETLVSRFTEQHVPVTYVGRGGKTSWAKAIVPLYRYFRKHQPDIVHCHLIDATIAGVIAARVAGVRTVIVHEHNTQKLNSWKVRVAYVVLRPLISLTICYAPTVEEENFGVVRILREPPKILEHRSYTIYNGVDIPRVEATKRGKTHSSVREELAIPEDSVVITSVARLVPWKGQENLLKAFSSLAQTHPNTHLVFVGEGDLHETLLQHAEQAHLSSRVHILGARGDVYRILSESDISVLAFVYTYDAGEAIGIAGFESMAFGLPLIASDYPSGRRIITHMQNGLLVKPADERALREAVEMLLRDPVLRVRLGETAKKTAYQLFDWRRIVPVYEQLYILLTI